jgi:hypothetical protein
LAVLALSGAACLLERATGLGAHDVELTQLEGGPRDVLWRQAQCDEGRDDGKGGAAEWHAAAATDGADAAADAAVDAGGPGGHLRALDD